MDNPLRVPIRNVLLHTGERVPLAGFYQERPLVLLFLRHLGCIFCKEQVAMVRDANDLNLAFVCLAQPGEASAFRESMNSPQPYFCEPEGDLYRDFGLGRGSFTQLVGPRMVMRGVQATLRGFSNSRPTADPRMLGGAFVVNTEGLVVWSHPAKDAAAVAASNIGSP